MKVPPPLIKFSKILNRIMGGDTNVTLCARLHLAKRNGSRPARLFTFILDRIFWFDPDHCRESYIEWRATTKPGRK